jgi:hypothetical protein
VQAMSAWAELYSTARLSRDSQARRVASYVVSGIELYLYKYEDLRRSEEKLGQCRVIFLYFAAGGDRSQT